MRKKYDVIIIGSGIGGLSAGTCLSKKGYKVLIIEKHNQPGGYCTSFTRSFFKFDTAAHMIGSCDEKDSFGNLIKTLDIKINFVQLNPSDRFFFYEKNDIIEIPSDHREFIQYLIARFKNEHANIQNFFDEVCKTKNQFLVPHIIKKYEHLTYQEVLDKFFGNNILKGILSAQCGFLGLPPSEVSAITAFFMLKMFMIDGAFYPRGGAQEIVNAFVKRFENNGGILKLATKAKKILTKNKKVIGVLLDSNELIESDFIISNIDCRTTFFDLVSSSDLDRVTSTKLKTFKVGNSCFAIYLGLNNKIELNSKNGWYYPDYNIGKRFGDLLYIHIPTNYDQSVVKKKGKQILILFTPLAVDNRKMIDWDIEKQGLVKKYLNRLEKLFPNLSANIEILEAATPKTFEKYTGNTNGSLYGWKQMPQQVYLNSFPQKTCIHGLFLAGHWTLPGGGIVTVALSGIHAANLVVKAHDKTIALNCMPQN